MRKHLLALCLLAGYCIMHGQTIPVHGLVSGNSNEHLSLVSIDAPTGLVIKHDTLYDVTAFAIGSSVYDDIDQHYTFLGTDSSNVMRMASWNLEDDSLMHFPAIAETINDLQYDMKSTRTYGLGNYVKDTVEIMPGVFQYVYATRFIEVDPVTGGVTEYAELPNLGSFPVGASAFDANGSRYFVNGMDSTLTECLFIIDATTGHTLSDIPLYLGPGEYLSDLEYDNINDQLYGIYRDLGSNVHALVSIDTDNNTLDTIAQLPGIQYFMQGASVFHQLTQTFILYYIDEVETKRLLLIDAKTGNIVSNPTLEHYVAELKTDNHQFALLYYHSTTGIFPAGEKKDLMKFFPNPATNFLKYEMAGDPGENTIIQIADVTGNVVYQQEVIRREGIIFLDDIPPGLYIAASKQDDHWLASTKITIVR